MKVVRIADRQPKKSAPFAKLTKMFTDPDLPLTASERLVALVIFQYVDLKTMKCWPSVGTITNRAKVSKNTVYETIKKLKEIGLIEVTKQRTKGRFDRNIYDFTNVGKRCDRVPR